MTNGDNIRDMTNDELAVWISLHSLSSCAACAYDGECSVPDEKTCIEGIMKWLESEESEQ